MIINRKLIFSYILYELFAIAAIYCLVNLWGFGEIKTNPYKFLTGQYEISDVYQLDDLLKADMIENAFLMEDRSLYSTGGDMVIRIKCDYQVRSVEMDVQDFTNPEGTFATAVTAHVYYPFKTGEVIDEISLLRVGTNYIPLNNSLEGEYIVSPTNVAKSAVTLSSVTLYNFKHGYLQMLLGGICFVSLTGGFIVFYITRKEIATENIILNDKRKFYSTLLFYVATGLISLTYCFFYFKYPHIIHPEVYGDFKNYANQDGRFFVHLIPKVFDCTMIELGEYRPRVLAFIWQYFDTNLTVMLNSFFPAFGIKMPLTLAMIPLSIGVWEYAFRKFFPNHVKGIGAFIGAATLFLPNILTATFLVLRSAKLITPVIVIGLITYSISHLQQQFIIKKYKKHLGQNILNILCVFLLCTLDEQILAVSAFVVALSVMVAIFDKKINRVAVNFTGALLIYITYYLWWGRWLFEYFTPVELQKHIHSISMIITDFNITFVQQAVKVYLKVLRSVFADSNIIVMIVGAVVLGMWIFIDNWKEKLVALALFAFSFALTIALLIGLPILYYYDDMIQSLYFITPALLIVYGIVYVISKSSLKKYLSRVQKCVGVVLCFICIIILLCINMQSVDKVHLKHLGINGGSVQFRDEFFDSVYFNPYYDSTIVTREQYDNYMEGKN